MFPYIKEAYDAKKWAFVTDVARLWIIYNYGGIYLDTDVELVKPLDKLLGYDAYFGLEDNKNINTGLGFGAKKNNIFVGKMLKDYEICHFKNEDGSYNLVTCPIRNTESVASLLPTYLGRDIIKVGNVVIYPPEFFCPLDSSGINFHKTSNTFSIHWFSATWLSEDEMVIHQWRIFCGKCQKYLGKKLGKYVARILYLFQPQKRNILKKYN